MNQKLSDWASIAEIISGVAVVVTLIFLVVGIHENTRTTRAGVFADSVENLNALNRTVMQDPDLSRIFAAFLDGQTAGLDGLDGARLSNIVATLFRTYDIAYSIERYELFGENEWGRFERQICRNYGLLVEPDLTALVNGVTSDEFSEYLQNSCGD